MISGSIGIDIGTTNTKMLVVGCDGRFLMSSSEKTPVITINGLVYFDLIGLEAIVDGFMVGARSVCTVRSVGFSSVGESVVPVRDGKAIHHPLMWNEVKALNTTQEIEFLNYESRFEVSGRHPNNLYSINKILWMLRKLDLGRVDHWLPLSSYFVYRKTGVAIWDYSQANRSFAYNPFKRCWNHTVLERYNLSEFAPLGKMGSACGMDEGITYGLGGHDHIVGLFGLKSLSNIEAPFYYDSMGTSCLLALLIQGTPEEFESNRTFSPQGGGIGGGFNEDEYIITRSFRYYGRALEQLMSWAGLPPNDDGYAKLNQRIMEEIPNETIAKFSIDGDFLSKDNAKTCMQIKNLKIGTSFEQLMFSLYAYLGTVSRMMFDDLTRFHHSREIPYFAGGRATTNHLLMVLKASGLGQPITIVNTPDLSALGAVVVGIQALGRTEELKGLDETFLKKEIIEPHKEYALIMEEIRNSYTEA